MAVTGEERHELHNHFEESMGRRMAANLMELLPPEGWGDLATKQDLLATRHDLATEIGGVRRDLATEIGGVRRDLAHLGALTGERFKYTWALMDERFLRVEERIESFGNRFRAELYRALAVQSIGLVTVMVFFAAFLG